MNQHSTFLFLHRIRFMPAMLCLLAIGVFSGCLNTVPENGQGREELVSEKEASLENPLPDMHNARLALDVEGLYSGIMPCADCPGIQTELEILPGQEYRLRRIYLERNQGLAFESQGSFDWDDSGNIIILLNEEPPNRYFVSENRIFVLDMQGNRIEGPLADAYQLHKQTD